MGFSRKAKAPEVAVNQSNVSMLAAEALAKQRAIQVLLPVRLITTAPILMKRWTDKAITQMLGKMVGQNVPRTNKDLTSEYEDSWYRNTDDVPAVPCRIIKACIVKGAGGTGGIVTGAQLKRELRVIGHTASLHGKNGKPLTGADLFMDVRVVQNFGTPDVRARAQTPVGSYMDIVLAFPPTLTPDKVVSALQAGGANVGLCDWRPDKGGEYGTFEVELLDNTKAANDRIIKQCSVPEREFSIPEHMLRAFGSVAKDKLSDPARKAIAVAEHVNGQKRGRKANAEANAE